MSAAVPVAAACGSIWTTCVPLSDGVAVIVAPAVPKRLGPARTRPSGPEIETLDEQQLEGPIVTGESRRPIRCPATPSNVARPFWPGTDMFSVTAGPPAAIAADASAGTSYSVSVA